MYHALGVIAVVGLIAFAFGERVARICVASVLVITALAFVYIMFRIVTGSI